MAATADRILGPFSSGEIPTSASERYDTVANRHYRVSDFLGQHQFDALLLQKPANIAWFSAGADCTRAGSPETVASLFITPDARVVVASNVDSGQIFDLELPGLGFQLKERPWDEPKSVLLSDLCRGRSVASDSGFGQTRDVSAEINTMRLGLNLHECSVLRDLGREVVHAVEATARALMPGRTEAEIAGELSHRLIKHQVLPRRIQVAGDERALRYRHWTYTGEPVMQTCVLSAVGSRHGLCAAVSRTVSFGAPDASLLSPFEDASLVHATAMYFTRKDWPLSETIERIRRIYDKFGHNEEWRLAEVGEVIGYDLPELPVAPKSSFRPQAGTPIHWHPTIGGAALGDTVLTTNDGIELLTPTECWPNLEISVKDSLITCPAILIREL